MPISDLQDGTFEYDALPTPTSIRLLSLAKRRKDTADALGAQHLIEVVLRTVDLSDVPIYKALSYTWGHPYSAPTDPSSDTYDDPLPIVMNGRLVSIKRNLHEALTQFLDPSAVHNHGIDRLHPLDQKTELIRASAECDHKLVAHCLERGADIHGRDEFGGTALHYAAEKRHLETVRTLISWGADAGSVDGRGRTPLACCKEGKKGQHEEVSRILAGYDDQTKYTISEGNHTKNDAFLGFDLWIDSLCINQNDIAERNAQVALMATIYSTATSVVAWLGPDDEDTEHIYSVFPVGGKVRKDGKVTDPKPDRWEATKALDLLSRRAWFRRRWVIQEFCLAHEIEMYCGHFSLDPVNWPPGFIVGISPGTQTVYQLLCLRRWYSYADAAYLGSNTPGSSQLPGLTSLMRTTWDSESTDPRDRVFALLGLASKAPAGSAALIADYSKSLADVFIEAGRHFVEDRTESTAAMNGEKELLEPLEGLSYVQNRSLEAATGETPGRLAGVPSWVPNFHQKLTTGRIYRPEFSACGKGVQHRAQDLDRLTLGVDGLLFDTIAEVETKRIGQEPRQEPYAANLAEWFGIISRLGNEYPGDPNLMRINLLRRTLTADDGNAGSTQARPNNEPFRDFVCYDLSRESMSDEQRRDILGLATSLSTPGDRDLIPTLDMVQAFKGPQSNVDAYRLGLYKYNQNRILVRSALGYLGLGPADSRPGDQIWLLAGGRTPYILRPLDSSSTEGKKHFHFVGESYVHGIMFGEAMKDVEVGFAPIQII